MKNFLDDFRLFFDNSSLKIISNECLKISKDAFSEKKVASRETIFWKHARGRALRDGDWKLVAQSRGEWELYNLAKDPTELDNLAGSHPEKVSGLRKKWQAWQDGQ